METIKKIVYREGDEAVIIEGNETGKIAVNFLKDLQQADKDKFAALKTYCLTKVNELIHVVYFEEGFQLHTEGKDEEGKLKLDMELTSEMTGEIKTMIDEVGVLCTTLLNQ